MGWFKGVGVRAPCIGPRAVGLAARVYALQIINGGFGVRDSGITRYRVETSSTHKLPQNKHLR